MKQTRRKLWWDRGGVSEVLGTILTLTITVVLFSGIIAMVNQFPAPGENVYTDFTATIEPIADWTEGAYIHITNTGGQQMTGLWTIIVVTIDDYTYTLSTKGRLPAITGPPYGLGTEVTGHRGNDDNDTDWDTGERWTLGRDENQITEASNVGVMIMEQEKNALVWTAQIQGTGNEFGPMITNIMADSDIGTLRSDPIQFGRDFYIYAEVYDPDGDLDMSSVRADLSSILPSQNNVIMTDPDRDGIFTGGPIIGPNSGTVPVGYHIVVIRANDDAGMQSTSSARVSVGMDLGAQPNLRILATGISVRPESPINGQTVSIAVTVENWGGQCNGNVTLYDIAGASNKTLPTKNFAVSQGPTQITLTFSWYFTPGGEHNISAWAKPFGTRDATIEDNWNYTNITVLPKILLVDDDNQPDQSDMDTVRYMKSALDSSDFGYDLYTVGPNKDGPGYNSTQMMMKNYDVVIWMTGYEKTSTLTVSDQENITDFLSGTLTSGNGGSLWMIGQNLYDDKPSGIPAIPDTFFQNILRASSGTKITGGPTSLLGFAANPVSFQWWNVTVPIITRVAGQADSWRITPSTATDITFNDPLNSTLGGNAVNYESATKSRLVFFPWEFSRIQNPGDQARVTYRVLKWLGNIPQRSGNDLAISEQTMSSDFVYFNQPVRVDAEIRNNGKDNLTTQVGLFLDGGHEPIYLYTNLTIPGGGSSRTVTANWNATELGKHVLKWKVDPNDLIDETNEGNNEVPIYITSGEVFVEFRILIVDDDRSSNNNGTLSPDTDLITDSLNRLGYLYEYSGMKTTYNVTGDDDTDGPSIDILKNYSSVIWITGESAGGLTVSDSSNLETYLNNYQGMLWLSGNDLWSNILSTNLSGDMGISNAVNLPLANTMRGVDGSPISHGMNISIAGNTDANALTPVGNATGVFYQSFLAKTYCAVMKDGGSYKGFTSAFNMSTFNGTNASYISGKNATDELVYMVLHWMNKPDTRNEVRVTERDYFVSDWHPQIGGAYIVRATVHNVGAEEVNVLVRFMDGSTQIGADSISISPDGQTSAELIWRPLFAGLRQMTILVDPINDTEEIFDWFNNNQTFSIYVYFFWDDMESGAGKWSHSSTLININGEGPLDFLGASYTTVNTDVKAAWDYTINPTTGTSFTVGVENTTTQYHSSPSSFYMEEPTGAFGVANVIVSFVIDDSRSMQDRYDGGVSWLGRAKDAAKTLLDQLSDDSVVVSIWDFNGNMERRWFGPDDHPMTSDRYRTQVIEPVVRLGNSYPGGIDGRQYIRDQIGDDDSGMVNKPGQTLLWDSIGGAYEDIAYYRNLYAGLTPAVIVLSDGADTQASDNAPISDNKIEGGSAFWCPWGDMSAGEITYSEHKGKYTFDWANPTTTTQWLRAMTGGGSMDNDRVGLLNPVSRFPFFTIGLGLEHHDMPPTPATTWTVWPGIIPDNTFALCTDVAVVPPCKESGTLEYNLWRIANTSGGEYFHAPSASDLEGVFAIIGQMLASGFNQTRSATPAPTTRAVNEDKIAVSPAVNLTQYQTAKFSFWHKYNLLSGGNGGIIGVEVWEPTPAPGSWKFLYIIPSGAYTGGIYYESPIYDGFGNPIKWCFNGISGGNTYSWDYTSVNILPFIEEQGRRSHANADYYKGSVRLAMKYVQFGGGTGEGWYIDDVKLDVSRADANPSNLTSDVWRLTNKDWNYGPASAWNHSAHSGNNAWWNGNTTTGYVKTGIDNSLTTNPIDLTNAKNASLDAYFKFNLNYASGSPPDGFRVEISSDGGVTWNSLSLGIRTSWNVSGTDEDDEYGIVDGKTYTGLTDHYNILDTPVENLDTARSDGYWVNADSLSRLNIDLSSWNGRQVIIRFRMVTNNLLTYQHYDANVHSPNPTFGGFYIDDVNVYGETIFG